MRSGGRHAASEDDEPPVLADVGNGSPSNVMDIQYTV